MLKFACQLAEVSVLEEEKKLDHLEYLGKHHDFHIHQIVQHMIHTTRCLLNYAYINNIDIESLNEGDNDYEQAKATWAVVTAQRNDDPIGYRDLTFGYSDNSYMYCIAVWNCAYQILLNENDVYNDTIGQFVEGVEELTNREITLGDERTQPLFKLISQIGDFRIHL
ncbi:hypothetical protein [Pedobacter sp. JCM 36344]|uniref:hypothetical protein n=1 Tax=Pedobacter sp. JCM 36344 TaxID=3374280 RepID=UPI00397A98D5